MTNQKHGIDISLLIAVIFLVVFGFVMIYSASSYSAQLQYDDAAYFLRTQMKNGLRGIAGMIIISIFFDYHICMKIGTFLYPVILIVLTVVLITGVVSHGARRWLSLGSTSFQPSEFAKIIIILTLAFFITRFKDKLSYRKMVLCVAGIVGVPFLLIASENLSTAIIVVLIGFIMCFIALRNIVVPSIAFILVILSLIFKETTVAIAKLLPFMQGFRSSRLDVWLSPESYSLSGGYQVLQGLYAVGSGGIMGKGLGESVQKMGFMPEAQNDMIFAIICEELGLFGAVSIIIIFLIAFYRMIIIAMNARDLCGSLIVIGVLAHIAVQLILNIAVVTNAIPNTGITLPFISFGGSSLATLLAEIGIVLNISRTTKT